jgi:hypothetical protein
MIVGVVVVLLLVIEMMTGTVRHRHSHAGRMDKFRTAKFAGRFDPLMVNFQETEPGDL